ncbi:MAG: CopD family protein [Steroidobacteraceae bacterium]
MSFMALMQAAGAVWFLLLLDDARPITYSVRRLARVSAMIALPLILLHHVMEAGRMAGEWSGVFDVSLQSLVLTTTTAWANGLRFVGSLLIALSIRMSNKVVVIIGALLIAISFTVTGHISIHPQQWWLTIFLFVHVTVAAFWFGSLLPLLVACRQAPQAAALMVIRFSAWASWLVPLLALLGVGMACALLPDINALSTPYGVLLLSKVVGFSLLMALAALNKWRLGPALVNGGGAVRAFRISVWCEYALLCVIFIATAVMTGLFSPEA